MKLQDNQQGEDSLNNRQDRRILRAFYNQYVAVLLIILVFNIGVAVRPFSRPQPSVAPVIKDKIKEGDLAGEIALTNIFKEERSTQIAEHSDLLTIEEVLRNHDIKAVFKIYVPLAKRSGEEIKRYTDLGISRSIAIKRWLLERQLPAKSFEAIVLTRDYPDSPASEQKITVSLEVIGREKGANDE
jgi:hypothetical protein